MLVYYFVPFIVSNRYLLLRDSNGHKSVTVQNRTHVYMNLFDHKDLGNHLLQLCPKVVKQPVYINAYFMLHFYLTSDRGVSEGHTSNPENGSIKIELKFNKPLSEAIT